MSNLTNQYVDQLREQATGSFSSGKDLVGKGLNVFGAGSDVFKSGLTALGKPLSYYEGLLGNRQEALTAAAPEVSTIQGQFDTAARAVAEFSPRGGGRVSRSADLPFTKQAAVQDVLTKQRPAAAQGITQIGQLLSQLGLSQEQVGEMLSQLGISEQQLGANELESAIGTRMGQTAQKNQLLGDLGQGIGTLLGSIFFGKG